MSNKRTTHLQLLLWRIASILISVLFVPIIIINSFFIVQTIAAKDEVPTIFGYGAVFVLSDSMKGEFETNDAIFLKEVDDVKTLAVGDIICYRDGDSFTTHRIESITEENGQTAFKTKGDANEGVDRGIVYASQIQGVYVGKIAGLYNIIDFMQSPIGVMLIFIIPCLVYARYEVYLWQRKKEEELDEVNAALLDTRAELADTKLELAAAIEKCAAHDLELAEASRVSEAFSFPEAPEKPERVTVISVINEPAEPTPEPAPVPESAAETEEREPTLVSVISVFEGTEAAAEEAVEATEAVEVVESTESDAREADLETPVEEIIFKPEATYDTNGDGAEASDIADDMLGDGSFILSGATTEVRLRRSFMARYIQADENIKGYYCTIKNLLLSYAKVKARTSWRAETFKQGRVHIAKIDIKGKKLYLYLALDPADYTDDKYFISDASSKDAAMPLLIKIKSNRSEKHAVELIEILAEKLGLEKTEKEPVDYRVPYETEIQLIKRGLIKVLSEVAPAEVESVPEAIAEVPAEETVTEAAVEEITVTAAVEETVTEAAVEEITEAAAVEEATEAAAEEETVTEAAVEEITETADVTEATEAAVEEETVTEPAVEEITEAAAVTEAAVEVYDGEFDESELFDLDGDGEVTGQSGRRTVRLTVDMFYSGVRRGNPKKDPRIIFSDDAAPCGVYKMPYTRAEYYAMSRKAKKAALTEYLKNRA